MVIRTRIGKIYKIYDLPSFEVFYESIKKLTQEKLFKDLNRFNSFNWDSDDIKQKFHKYYDTHSRTNFRQITNELHCNSDKPNTKEFWIERGWSEQEAIEKVSSVQSKCGKRFVEKFRNDSSIRCTSNQLKWWLDKGYSKEEAKELLMQRQSTFSKKSCIEEYGEVKGEKVFKARQAKWRKTINERFSKETQLKWKIGTGFHSKMASDLFEPFYDMCKNLYKCYMEPHTKEYFIYNKDTQSIYFYDFTIKELGLIFEYQGEHVHPNPSWPKEKWDSWKQTFTGKSADEVQSNYNKKIQTAEQSGFKVVQLWGSCSNEELSKIITFEISSKLQSLQQ